MYKLLIVDDELFTRNFLKNIIPTLSSDWEVVADVMDGSEALEILNQQHVDLVLTDIKMPIIDGLELCKQIHFKYPNIHCIILSGYGEFDYAKQALKYNVNNYLLKPIVNDELKKALNSIAKICNEKDKQKIKYDYLISASNKYKEEIIAKLLKAIITNSHIEIKSLYPLLYDLEINLIDEEAVIIIFQISEYLFIENDIDLSNIILIKLLLFNIVKNYITNSQIKAFIDSEENTVLLVPIKESTNLQKYIESIYKDINAIFFSETNMHILCLVGNKENELLQINNSYNNAKKVFLQSLFFKNNSHVLYYNSNDKYNSKIKLLKNYMSNLLYSIHNNDIINLEVISKDMGDFIFNNIVLLNRLKVLNLIISHLLKNNNIKEDVIYKLYKILLKEKNNLHNSKALSDFIKQIGNILMTYINKKDSSYNENFLVEKAKQFIYNHYMEPISLSFIAEQLNVSPSYLSNLFHKSEGKSYVKFLTEVRLKHAINLLKNENLKLDYISKNVGYISVKHFCYVFKKYYNVTPSEYRSTFK